MALRIGRQKEIMGDSKHAGRVCTLVKHLLDTFIQPICNVPVFGSLTHSGIGRCVRLTRSKRVAVRNRSLKEQITLY